MRWRHWGLELVVVLLGIPATAWSIEIVDPVSKRSVFGFVVRRDDQKVAIRIRTPDGKDQVKEYELAKTKIIYQLDQDRLEKLSQESPRDYQAYAQVLAEKKADPEMRETAMRLFLIAAYLKPEQLGPSCLLRMSALAEAPADARKYKAMAVLLDPSSDPMVLKRDDAKSAGPASQVQTAALANFQKALHFYRTGQPGKAKEHAHRDGADKLFSRAPGMMEPKVFLQLCADAVCTTCKMKKIVKCTTCGGTGKTVNQNGEATFCTICNGKGKNKCSDCDGTGVNATIPPDKLRMVIQAELWALSPNDGSAQAAATETRWSSILQARKIGPVPIMDLLTISEFDPRQCVFREWKWVTP